MSGRDPDEIWQTSVEEGDRRLSRGVLGLASTGTVGGIDVMIGVLVLAVVSGALGAVLPYELAHVGGSLVFGIGFVMLTVGRSELFTENFLVPISAMIRGSQRRFGDLSRLWAVTALSNLIAMLAMACVFSRPGLIPPDALTAAGAMADTFAERDFVAALLSAIVAGAVMTLFTWLLHAVELDVSRILISLLIGFVLAAPSLNHAIVGFGEMVFGLLAGTAEEATWSDLARNLPTAVLGNLIGGLGFVTVLRAMQVQGEPD